MKSIFIVLYPAEATVIDHPFFLFVKSSLLGSLPLFFPFSALNTRVFNRFRGACGLDLVCSSNKKPNKLVQAIGNNFLKQQFLMSDDTETKSVQVRNSKCLMDSYYKNSKKLKLFDVNCGSIRQKNHYWNVLSKILG